MTGLENKDFSLLEESLGIFFDNKDFLQQAFIHRSYLNENPDCKFYHNERLEFLGDAVLELVITDFLFHKYPKTPEGQLTAYRSSLVRTESISAAADHLNFGEFLLLSKGESRDMGRARAYILANTFESFIGGLYMDKGYDAARDFISKQLFDKIDVIVEKGMWRDPKSWVQEKAQENYSVTPTYTIIDQVGPDHNKIFTVGVIFGDEIIAEGQGTSKQEAQQQAARAAILKKGWEVEEASE